jgi:hypothetical protein
VDDVADHQIVRRSAMSDGLEHLDDPGAQEFALRPASSARLLRRDGFSRVIPIGFLWKEGKIVVCTAPSAPKVAALTKRPNVAVTIDTGNTSDTAKQLLIRGTAAIDIVNGVASEYIEASGKTLSGTDLEEFEAQVQGVFEQ